MTEKRCTSCGQTKLLSNFSRDNNIKSGYRSRCKACIYTAAVKEREKDPERVKDRFRRYYQGHRSERIIDAQNRQAADPVARRARNKLTHEIRMGRMERPDNCSKCGDSSLRIEGHHEDYSKPLEVIWLCQSCHTKTTISQP